MNRWKQATAKLSELYPTEEDLTDSTLAARLNGFVKGHGTLKDLKEEIFGWKKSEKDKQKIIATIDSIKW
ncbi:hypothetical protein [Salipaludibacillus keqinensis]|uniref:hypothetical protein n=1 Tax=Salipaludibacillus keqinensis TaxID=2045207 RepID=UPI002FCDF73C